MKGATKVGDKSEFSLDSKLHCVYMPFISGSQKEPSKIKIFTSFPCSGNNATFGSRHSIELGLETCVKVQIVNILGFVGQYP